MHDFLFDYLEREVEAIRTFLDKRIVAVENKIEDYRSQIEEFGKSNYGWRLGDAKAVLRYLKDIRKLA